MVIDGIFTLKWNRSVLVRRFVFRVFRLLLLEGPILDPLAPAKSKRSLNDLGRISGISGFQI